MINLDDIYEEISKIRGSNNTLMHSIETSGCQNSSTSSILGRKIDEATSSSDVSNNILLFIGAKSSRLLPIWLLSFNNRYHKIFHYVSELEKLEIFE